MKKNTFLNTTLLIACFLALFSSQQLEAQSQPQSELEVQIEHSTTEWEYQGGYATGVYGTGTNPAGFDTIKVPFEGGLQDQFTNATFGDLDNDGDLDFIAAATGRRMYFYENFGTATAPQFARVVLASLDTILIGRPGFDNYVYPELVDIDNDGDLDLFVGSSYSYKAAISNSVEDIQFFENIGTPSVPAFSHNMAKVPGVSNQDISPKGGYITAVDMDADGDFDLVCMADMTIVYFRNVGTASAPNFQRLNWPFGPFSEFSYPYLDFVKAVFKDFDNDGDLDLYFTDALDGNLLYSPNLGTASAPFFPKINYGIAALYRAGRVFPMHGGLDTVNAGRFTFMEMEDINGDGLEDLILCENAPTGFMWWKGVHTDPSLTFEKSNTSSIGASDGTVTATALGEAPFTFQWSTSFTETTSSTSTINSLAVGSYVVTVTDGRGATNTESINILEPKVEPFYSKSFSNAMGSNSAGLNAIALPTTPIANLPSTFNNFASLTLGDVDGDNLVDFITGDGDGNLTFFKNTGTATAPFWQQTSLFTLDTIRHDYLDGFGRPQEHPIRPTLVDIDSDGDLDLFVAFSLNYHGSEFAKALDEIAFFRNIGSPTNPIFTEDRSSIPGLRGQNTGEIPYLEFGDLDNDGDLDMISMDRDSLSFWENTGVVNAPTFARRTSSANPFFGFENFNSDATIPKPVLLDHDRDGDLDLFYASNDGFMRFVENMGTANVPSFDSLRSLPAPSNLGSIDLGGFTNADFADVTNDGILDLVVTNWQEIFPGSTTEFGWLTRNTTGPEVFVKSTNLSCIGGADGSASADMAVASGAVSYLWSNAATTKTINNLMAGTYTVSVTDNNVTLVDTVVILDPPVFSTSIIQGDSVLLCKNDSVIITVASVLGVTNHWLAVGDPAFTIGNLPASADSYTVKDTGKYVLQSFSEKGCVAFDTISAVFSDLTVTAVLVQPDDGSRSGIVNAIVAGGVMPYTYQWHNFPASSFSSVGGFTSSSTRYPVTVTDGLGCKDTASILIPLVMPPQSDTATVKVRWKFEGGNLNALTFNGAQPLSTGPNPSGLDAASLPTFVIFGSVTIGDVDGDGDQDFISGGNKGQLYFFENTGTSTNPNWSRSSTIVSLNTIRVGDSHRGGSAVYLKPKLADIDADGDLDLIVGSSFNQGGSNPTDGILFFRNTGTATAPSFSSDTLSGIANQDLSAFPGPDLADIDADGDLDLLVLGSDSGSYMENTGTATNPMFQRRIGTSNILDGWNDPATLTAQPSFNDFDADGDLDIYYITDNGAVRVIANIGTASTPDFGSFTSSSIPSLDTVNFIYGGIIDFADLNGDGLLDFIAHNPSPASWAWFSQISGPIVALVNNNISCNGLTDGSATATASGVTPFFYQWSTGDTLTSSGASTISGLSAGTYTVTVTENGGKTATVMATITEPAALVASSVVDSNVSCNGLSNGGATASATGGTTPYTYLWSNSATTAAITGVAAGTYGVTITDNSGCTSTSSVNVTEPSALVAATVVDANDTGGNTGAATASETGGTAPYTYTWSNSATTASITAVAAGTYSVTITDNNGCTDTSSVTIVSGPSASITVNSNISCNGLTDGSVTATASGTAPFFYQWSTGDTLTTSGTSTISNLAAGTYTVTVVENGGLTATDMATITEPALLTVAINEGDSAQYCVGDSVALSTVNQTGVNFDWYLAGDSVSIETIGNAGFSDSSTAYVDAYVNNGTTYVVYQDFSDGFKTTVKKFDGTNWITVGNRGFSPPASYQQITLINDTIYVAFQDFGNGTKASVMKFDGTNWVYVGSPGFSAASAIWLSLKSSNGVPYLAYRDAGNSSKATVMAFDGSTWVNVGNAGISDGPANNIEIEFLNGTPYIVYSDLFLGLTTNKKITVKKFDGTNWLDEGIPRFTQGNAGYPKLEFDDNGIAFVNYEISGKLMAMTFDGSNWVDISTGLPNIIGPDTEIKFYNNTPYILYLDRISFKNTIKKYESGAWVDVKKDFSMGDASYLNLLQENNNLYAVYTDKFNTDKATVQKLTIGSPILSTSNSVNIKKSGEYIIKATNQNGCVAFDTVVVAPSSIMAAAIVDANDTGGNTGAATASATGGTTPYSYAWSNSASTASITNLAVGIYTVTITDNNGCTDTNSVTILSGPSISFTAVNNVSCNAAGDGNITATISGGQTPYTYSWSNGSNTNNLTLLMAGKYILTVTDANNISAVDSVTITQPAVYSVAIDQADSVQYCVNDSVQLTTGLQTGATYEWFLEGAGAVSTVGPRGFNSTSEDYDLLVNRGDKFVAFKDEAASDKLSIMTFDGTSWVYVGAAGISDGDVRYANMAMNNDTLYVAYKDEANGDKIGMKKFNGTTWVDFDTTGFNGRTIGQIDLVFSNGTPCLLVPDNAESNKLSVLQYTAGSWSVLGNAGFSRFSPANEVILKEDNDTLYACHRNSSLDIYVHKFNGATWVELGGTALDFGGAEINMAVENSVPYVSFSNISGFSLTVKKFDGVSWVAVGPDPFTSQQGRASSIQVVNGIPYVFYQDQSANSKGTLSYFDGTAWKDLGGSGVTEGVPAGMSHLEIDGNEFVILIQDLGVNFNNTVYSLTNTPPAPSQPSFYVNNSGSYVLRATNAAGCLATDTITVLQTDLMAAVAVDSNDVGNGGGATASATGGVTPYTYLWSNSATTASITAIAAGVYTVTITDNNGCADTNSVTIVAGPVITMNLDSNVTCNGLSNGGATANVIGGVMPYTYAWSTSTSSATFATTASITGITTAKYYLTVTDNNGLTDVDSVIITEPALLVAATVIDSNVTCKSGVNGGATASATGGTAPYTYAWSTSTSSVTFATTASITVVAAGTYSVTITDNNGCTSNSSVTITEPDSLIFTVLETFNASCNGGSDGGFRYVISGGTPFISGTDTTYRNETGDPVVNRDSLRGAPAGMYKFITIDMNGCESDTARVNITEPTAVVASISIDSNVTCNGFINGGATASATGGTGAYTYLWSTSTSSVTFATTASITGVAAGSYTVTISDASGCTDSETTTITEPTAIVTITSVDSAASCANTNDGGYTVTASGGTGAYTYLWSTSTSSVTFATTASVTGVTPGKYYLTVTDANNCTKTDSVEVPALDVTAPTVLTQNINVYLDASGTTTIAATDIDNGSTDNCGIATRMLDSTTFDCSEVGANTVKLYVTDLSGNVDSATAVVTVLDTLIPNVLTQNVTVYLDVNGAASITTSDVDNGSNDNCSTVTLALDSTSFDCTEVGANTVKLYVTDANNNVDSATAAVTVLDTLNPIVITQNVTVYLDATGSAGITTADVDNGSNDNCSIVSLSLSKTTSFDCSEVGTNTVTLYVTDANNNIDSSTAVVTVLDTLNPNVLAQNVTVYLDASGAASITTADVDNGSNDNCSAITLALDSTNFDCSEVGANTVTLYVTDANSNIDSATATVTVLDTLNPNVLTQNVTVYLDASGAASITTADVDNGSNDNCTVVSLSLSKTTNFDCSEVGVNTVKLYVTDANNNVDSATATVTVLDTLNPIVIAQNITVYLDASGSASITTADIDNGSNDNCSTITLGLDSTSFDCSEVGANTVKLYVTDANNNIDSATATITVLDTLNPNVLTQNVTVYLDANGAASITTTDINNGSNDNCAIQTISLDKMSFNCSDEGSNTVQLRITDVNNNVDSASAIVTVLDTINPLISGCPANISQVIDAGNCTALVTWIAPTAADNCTVDSLVSSHTPGDVFALGTTTVTYIAYDPEMNTDTCRFTITITDDEDPVIVNAPVDITTSNDAGICGAVISWTEPTATDNCNMDSLRSNVANGTTFQVGTTTVTYTAYDVNGNTSIASFTVTVNDTTKPVITCPIDIAQCDSIVNFMDATATDNCAVASIVRSDVTGLNTGDQFPVGISTLSYLVTDVNGNQETCDVGITVYAPSKANAGEDLATRDIEPIQIEASSVNAASFRWSPSFTIANDTVEQPLVNPRETTTYTMTVTSPDGCTVTDDVTVTVTVVNKLDATTLFSPNGDGRNDTWTVNKPELVENCRLSIFNRNGTEVYNTTNYNNDWDGTINGTQLPEGTYYYVFDCPDQESMSGPITILRERR